MIGADEASSLPIRSDTSTDCSSIEESTLDSLDTPSALGGLIEPIISLALCWVRDLLSNFRAADHAPVPGRRGQEVIEPPLLGVIEPA